MSVSLFVRLNACVSLYVVLVCSDSSWFQGWRPTYWSQYNTNAWYYFYVGLYAYMYVRMYVCLFGCVLHVSMCVCIDVSKYADMYVCVFMRVTYLRICLSKVSSLLLYWSCRIYNRAVTHKHSVRLLFDCSTSTKWWPCGYSQLRSLQTVKFIQTIYIAPTPKEAISKADFLKRITYCILFSVKVFNSTKTTILCCCCSSWRRYSVQCVFISWNDCHRQPLNPSVIRSVKAKRRRWKETRLSLDAFHNSIGL